MGEVNEQRNDSPLLEDVKAIIDYVNHEYDENHSWFDKLSDYKHVGIAYDNTGWKAFHSVWALNLEEKNLASDDWWNNYPKRKFDLDEDNAALTHMKEE